MKENTARILVELEQIRKGHGGVLRPPDVVDFAADDTTALHSQFTWDDDEAARQYRLWQARQIIRVCVTVIPGINEPVRAYVSLMNDRNEDGGGYRSVVRVASDPDLRAAMLEEAKADMKTFIEKYKVLAEVAEIISAMEKIARRLGEPVGVS